MVANERNEFAEGGVGEDLFGAHMKGEENGVLHFYAEMLAPGGSESKALGGS